MDGKPQTFRRSTVGFVITAALPIILMPVLVLIFLNDPPELPDYRNYEVVTKQGKAGPIVARRSATEWDVIYEFAAGPAFLIFGVAGGLIFAAFYNFRSMRELEPVAGNAASIGRKALIALGAVSILTFAVTSISYRPSPIVYVRVALALGTVGVIVFLCYRIYLKKGAPEGSTGSIFRGE